MRIPLDGRWTITTQDGQNFPGEVPGTIYTSMLKYGLCPDPYYGQNEEQVRKISEQDFIYSTVFDVDAKTAAAKSVTLCFDGIDTVADIFLNGEKLGSADNMYLAWEFDVRGILKTGSNELKVRLCSPIIYVQEKHRQKQIWGLPESMTMIGYSQIRKAHYMFGWDWCPKLPDMGIFRSVYLRVSNDALIRDVYIRQFHEEGAVTLTAHCECDFYDRDDYVLEYTVLSPKGEVKTALTNARGVDAKLTVENPQLWWPRNLGKQHLYIVTVRLMKDNVVVDDKTMKIGLRTLTVSTAPDDTGSEFCFVANGKKFIAMGANYIPEDNILGLRSRGRTERLLKSCADANFNCIRVWGGGFYPDHWFYDLCDKYGFVVWHDFMFACGFYVYRDEFRESILKELDYNIRRVRNHPCIGLWCGNNEVEMARFWSHGKPEDIDEFRQYYLESYEKDFPALVSKLAPDTFYWPSSPSSGGNFDAANEPERGDIHYWDLWQGKGRWDAYKELNFKFLSEFGFESLPDMKTIESFAGPEDFDLESPVMQSHQKCPDGNNKMRYYMEELAHIPCDFESLVYVSQLIHAQVISGIIEFIRQKRNCNGVLYWQLNDTNPVISGSSIDYFGRWKALHYYIKRVYDPLLLSVNADCPGNIRVDFSNQTRHSVRGKVFWALKTLDGSELASGCEPLSAEALSSAEIKLTQLSSLIEPQKESVYLRCEFVGDNGKNLRALRYFDILKNLALSEPAIHVDVSERETAFILTLSCNTLAKDIFLHLSGLDCAFSDNWFDLEASEKREIRIGKDSLPQDFNEEDLRNSLKIISYHRSL